MIFQNLVAYCQPVQLQDVSSGLVIEPPDFFPNFPPNNFSFKTDTTTEITTDIEWRSVSERPPVTSEPEIPEDPFTNHGCNQSVKTQTKPYFGFFGPLTQTPPSPCSSSSMETTTDTMKRTIETMDTTTETTEKITDTMETTTEPVSPSITSTISTTSSISPPPRINLLLYTYTTEPLVSPPCHAIIEGVCSEISCGEEVTLYTTLPACLWHTLSSKPEIIQNQISVAVAATHLAISPNNETNEDSNSTSFSSQIISDEPTYINGARKIVFHRYAICALVLMLF